jgi:hypothetical protein
MIEKKNTDEAKLQYLRKCHEETDLPKTPCPIDVVEMSITGGHDVKPCGRLKEKDACAEA